MRRHSKFCGVEESEASLSENETPQKPQTKTKKAMRVCWKVIFPFGNSLGKAIFTVLLLWPLYLHLLSSYI